MKHARIGMAEKVERLCDKVVLILGIGIYVALAYYSLRYTEWFKEGTEIIETHKDSEFANLLALALVLVLFGGIRKILERMDACGRDKVKKIVAAIALIYIAVISIAWVALSHFYPRADAGTISLAAELMGEGNFTTMYPHGYLGHNPHQFGLALLLEILYFFFGAGNYAAFAYFNALCMPVLVYAGYKILHLLYENDVMEIYYFLLMAVCVPLYVYVIHIYGEISSTTLCMVFIWQTMVFCKRESKICALIMIISGTLACLLRMNSVIVVIAATIVLLIYGVRNKKAQMLLLIACMFFSIFAVEAGVKKLYEHRSGMEAGGGIPYISYMLMGLEDTEAGPGWFNGTNYTEYAENNFDTEATAQSSMVKFKARVKELLSNKGEAVSFFKRKVLTQWNSPDYGSFYTVEEFNCEIEELPELTQSIFMGNAREFLNTFMNGYQFVVYMGVVVSLICALKRQNPIESHMLLIAIVGGFLFSVIWEAMNRYIIPYMAFAVPLAAAGIYEMQWGVRKWWLRIKEKCVLRK